MEQRDGSRGVQHRDTLQKIKTTVCSLHICTVVAKKKKKKYLYRTRLYVYLFKMSR